MFFLYGDAGSGKSSTVKAIANEFKDDGLRLIEVKKKSALFPAGHNGQNIGQSA